MRVNHAKRVAQGKDKLGLGAFSAARAGCPTCYANKNGGSISLKRFRYEAYPRNRQIQAPDTSFRSSRINPARRFPGPNEAPLNTASLQGRIVGKSDSYAPLYKLGHSSSRRIPLSGFVELFSSAFELLGNLSSSVGVKETPVSNGLRLVAKVAS